jgi:hypothetical protein
MEDVDYVDIASRYGIDDVRAQDLFEQWMAEEDPDLGESEPNSRFDRFISLQLNATDPPKTSPLCENVFEITEAKETTETRTPVEFVPSPLVETVSEPSEASFETVEDIILSEEEEPHDSVYTLPPAINEPLEAAFDDAETYVETHENVGSSFIAEAVKTSSVEASDSSSPLESWDDLLAAVDEATTSVPTAATSKPFTGIKDQARLKQLLLCESNHISDKFTTNALVFAVVPHESVSSKTLKRIRDSKDEKKMFVLSHLLVQAGVQPESQLLDRPYRSLDGTEYSIPSTGDRRLVRRGNIPFLFGKVDSAVTNKYDKKIKPIYLLSDQVLG